MTRRFVGPTESQEETERLIGKGNKRGKARLLELNAKNTKLRESWEDTVLSRNYSAI